ncbi:MAG: radical SAM protein [Bacillota bacterium]
MRAVLLPEGLNLVCPGEAVIRFDREEAERLLGRRVPWDSLGWLPEVVHIEITTRCDLRCPECYVRASGMPEEDMPVDLFRKVVAELAELPLLNVTFGGGEPTMHPDFPVLVRIAREAGLELAMTTNGRHLEGLDLRAFRQVNVSYHGSLDVLNRALGVVAGQGVPAGVNLVCDLRSMPALPDVARLCRERGVELLLLTYKPVIGDVWNQVAPARVRETARELNRQGVRVALDGMACECCLAARRFCDISVCGEVYPCSFLRKPAGSLAEKGFLEVWRRLPHPETCPYQTAGPN